MFRFSIRTISLCSLAAYLLASAMALVHSHEHVHALGYEASPPATKPHSSCSHASSHCHGHEHSGHSHHGHAHPHAPGHGPTPAHDHHQHDDCLACQFLAVKSATISIVLILGQTDQVTIAEPAAIAHPETPAPSLPFSRGPPLSHAV